MRLLWFEPLFLLLISPLILIPGQAFTLDWQPLFVALLFLFWPLRLAIQGDLGVRTPLDILLWLLLIWLPVGVWVSVDRSVSWVAVGYLALGITSYIACVNWPPFQHRPALLAGFIVLCGTSLALLTPLLILDAENLPLARPFLETIITRLDAFSNPNVVAGALILVSPLLLSLILHYISCAKWLPAALFSTLLAANMAAIILSQSRGAQFAVLIALLVVIVGRWSSLAAGVIVLFGGICLIVYFAGPTTFLERIIGTRAFSLETGGLTQRIEIWRRAYYALNDFSITGIGIGLFASVIPVVYPFHAMDGGLIVPHAHNLYLQLGVDLGIVGLALYVAILMATVFIVWRRLIGPQQTNSTELQQMLAAGLLGTFTALALHGLVDAVTWGTKLSFFPFLFAALAVLPGLKVNAAKV